MSRSATILAGAALAFLPAPTASIPTVVGPAVRPHAPGTLPAGGARVAPSTPAQDPAPGPATNLTLREANVRVSVDSPRTGSVDAEYRFDGARPVAVAVVWPRELQLLSLRVEVDDRLVAPTWGRYEGVAARIMTFASATGEVGDAASTASTLKVGYELRLPPGFASRFPLPVPLAPPPADRRAVRLTVLLPEGGGSVGDVFPVLVPVPPVGGRQVLEGRMIAVPSLVQVGSRRFGWLLEYGDLIVLLAIAGAAAAWGWHVRGAHG